MAAIVALAWANSPWQAAYERLWTTELIFSIGGFELAEDLRHWVNEGLMVLFFFVVGLEIKTELVAGELSDARRAALPAAAAVGGMVAPALIYTAVNLSGGATQGWGIPVATDIAFAVGVVALLGRRVPQALKIFLLALAIVDDVGAVLVIAFFYTGDLSPIWLAVAAGLLAVVALMRWLRVWYVPAYAAVGAGLWLATFQSGVHATVAGVALALFTPARPLLTRPQAQRLEAAVDGAGHGGPGQQRDEAFLVRESQPVAERLQDALHPWTSYVVIPLFALANGGVTLDRHMVGAALESPVTLGVAIGLLAGKPIGVVGFAWLATRLRVAALPSQVSWRQMAGVAVIAGIGFTMSLFIAGLAFSGNSNLYDQAKLGIFSASLLAAAIGAMVLSRGPDKSTS